jgi:hypothetical protein
MIESEGITESVTSWRTDAVARIINAVGLENIMFEAAGPPVFEWYVKNYVNLFVDHSQIVQLECLHVGTRTRLRRLISAGSRRRWRESVPARDSVNRPTMLPIGVPQSVGNLILARVPATAAAAVRKNDGSVCILGHAKYPAEPFSHAPRLIAQHRFSSYIISNGPGATARPGAGTSPCAARG